MDGGLGSSSLRSVPITTASLGRIRQVFDDFVILEQEQVVNKESNTSNLKEVMLKKDHIVSVWIYNTK